MEQPTFFQSLSNEKSFKEAIGTRLLLISLSDNADHQDTLFGIFEAVRSQADATVLAIKHPKVPVPSGGNVILADCPERPGLCKKTFSLFQLMRLMRFVRKGHFDVVWFESLHVWNLALQLCCNRAVTYHVIHEVTPHDGDAHTRLVRLMTKTVALCADRIVLRNRLYKEEMCERFHLPAEHVLVSELWRRFPPYTPPVHSKEFLFFGRMNPYKGVELLLPIARSCPEVSFRIIGQVSKAMKETAEALKQLPNVTLTEGYVSNEEMQNAFEHADWIVLPYHSASQSGVVIDAYKYSRPVICFDVGAISEQVEDGKTGYLVPAGEINKFADRIREAVSLSACAYDAFSMQAYEYGCAKYSAAGAVNRFLALIQKRD